MIAPALRKVRRPGRVERIVAVVLLVVVALLIPQVASSFLVSLALNVLIYGLLAMSLDLLTGYSGLVSLGHASFMGVGAYGLAYGLKIGWAPWQAAGLGVGAALVAGLLVGPLAVRVRGLTFAILTLAVGQLLWGLAFRWVGVSGGDSGLPAAPRPMLGPFDLANSANFYYFALGIWMISTVLLFLIVRSSFGLTLRGLRDNETRMAALGYYVGLHKYVVFVIGVFFAGIAGVLLAYGTLYVSPSLMDFTANGTAIQMVIIGGPGTLWGPMLGAVIFVFLGQFLSLYVARWVTLMGLVMIVVVLFARRGLWGELAAAAARGRRWWDARRQASDIDRHGTQ